MRTYRWVCHVCETGNAPELNQCSKCGFPAEATGLEIDSATKISKRTKKNVSENVSSKYTWTHIFTVWVSVIIFFNFWVIYGAYQDHSWGALFLDLIVNPLGNVGISVFFALIINFSKTQIDAKLSKFYKLISIIFPIVATVASFLAMSGVHLTGC